MAISRARSNKHLHLHAAKIKRAQKIWRTRTEIRAIERALDLMISEYDRNRMAADAPEHFVESGVESKDIYGTLHK